MSEQSWKPMFRTPTSSLTKVLQSSAFRQAREQASSIIESPAELRSLAVQVEALDRVAVPLSAIDDQVCAALRFLRATAVRLDSQPAGTSGTRAGPPQPDGHAAQAAGSAVRERLVVASLRYLIRPDDLVPDFRAGGYIDDVLLLSWVFGAAVKELAPYSSDPTDAGLAAPEVTSA